MPVLLEYLDLFPTKCAKLPFLGAHFPVFCFVFTNVFLQKNCQQNWHIPTNSVGKYTVEIKLCTSAPQSDTHHIPSHYYIVFVLLRVMHVVIVNMLFV